MEKTVNQKLSQKSIVVVAIEVLVVVVVLSTTKRIEYKSNRQLHLTEHKAIRESKISSWFRSIK